MRLEGEESQTHIGEDEVLCQEVQQLKQLMREDKGGTKHEDVLHVTLKEVATDSGN